MKKTPDDKKNIEIAAALRYDPEKENAPTVVAEGKGAAARHIKELAEQHEVPVYRDEALATTLSRLGAGSEIPESLYEAVAEILVFIAEIDKNMREKINFPGKNSPS